MIVVGIETSTPQTSVAVGKEDRVIASTAVSGGRTHHEALTPALEHLLKWTQTPISSVGGVAVGIGPGLFTGLRVGIETGKTLAQVLGVPIVGLASLDVLAFSVRFTRRLIAAAIDARRGEVFFCLYRAVPGGVARQGEFEVGSPDRLLAELDAHGEDVLLVGDGAMLYRREIEKLGGRVEFASPAFAYPHAGAMVELSVPRFEREEFDRVFDVVPLYLRKSDAELNWDRRAGAGQA